jgi:hypothetical protein
MGIFRKPDRPAESVLAIAASEQIAARVLGSPLSLGVRVITAETLGGRVASRGLVTSAEAFRLGVIGVFTLVAQLKPDIRSLGVLHCGTAAIAAAYRGDRIGAGKMPLQEYLSAFGIDLLPEGDVGLIRAGDAAVSVSGPKKYLIIVHDVRSLEHLGQIWKGRVVYPVVKDNGKTASMADR